MIIRSAYYHALDHAPIPTVRGSEAQRHDRTRDEAAWYKNQSCAEGGTTMRRMEQHLDAVLEDEGCSVASR